jgi:hypothetical protein
MPTAASASLRAAIHDALTAYFGGRSLEKVAKILGKK